MSDISEAQTMIATRKDMARLMRSIFSLCKWRFFLFMVISVAAALSEGISVLMLAPILESDVSSLAGNPVMDVLMSPFAGHTGKDRIILVASVLIAVLLARGILVYSTQALGSTLPIYIQRVLSEQAYDRLLGARMGFVSRLDIGDVGNILLHFPLRASKTMRSVADIFANVVLASVYLVLMIVLAGPMALTALVFIVLLYLLMRKLTLARIAQAGNVVSIEQANMNGLFVDTYHGLSLIHQRCAEQTFRLRYRDVVERFIRATRRNTLTIVSYGPVMTTVSGLMICVGLIAGVSFADNLDGLVSRMLLFMIVLYRLLTPVSTISSSQGAMQMQIDAFLKLEKFLADADAARQPDGDRDIATLRNEIAFGDVRFAYEQGVGQVLKGVSFSVPRGMTVAIIGPSGAGKSTIISLLTRMYEVTDGDIIVDGTPLRDVRLSSWRKLVGVVSQDIFLFNDSVYNNLTLGLGAMPRDTVWSALEYAAAKDFVEALPDGLDTLLGERGDRLSGGQRQRLAIARTLLADPEILILDEATSQLDTETEQAIQKLLKEYHHGKTVIVIAHRLTTIQDADRIVVLESGQVTEVGSPSELMQNDSRYRQLLRSQISDS